MKKIIIIAVTLLLAGVASADVMALRNLNVGDMYPQFCGSNVDGKKICSNDFGDNVLVLSFLKIEQARSKKAMLSLQEVFDKFNGKKVTVLGIISGEINKGELSAYKKENKLTFPIILDTDRSIYGLFGVFVYPSTIISGQDKTLQYMFNSNLFNYTKRLNGTVSYLLKEINEDEFDEILHPVYKKIDQEVERRQRYYNGAYKHYTKKNFGKAEKLVKISLMKYPDHAQSHSLYGYLYIREKDYKSALKHFEKALEVNPDLEEAKIGKQICLDNFQ